MLRPCRLVVKSSRCGIANREAGGSNPPWDTFFLNLRAVTGSEIGTDTRPARPISSVMGYDRWYLHKALDLANDIVESAG